MIDGTIDPINDAATTEDHTMKPTYPLRYSSGRTIVDNDNRAVLIGVREVVAYQGSDGAQIHPSLSPTATDEFVKELIRCFNIVHAND
ncbi:hypothetical protein UFOVP75_20 [uncultured Caudovirales phage]|uniref:Uncharacterized protein n=1 Tax=uncultured Caudovirales phage TaxID=2100421 RepID=A0A6J5L090_9CAUD|nr:hypothetical protein UFOVP75_20 [uncultured Caudovirales phage]